MKKIASLVLAGLMALSLAACGGQNGAGDQPLTINLSEFYTEMYDSVFPDPDNAPAMVALEGEMLEQAYPGLSEVETTQCLVYAPMITAVAYEVALVEVASADDVATVQEIFQARIDSQVESGAFYPATVEAWQNNSEIVTRENYIALFVGAEKDQMVEAFNAAGSDDSSAASQDVEPSESIQPSESAEPSESVQPTQNTQTPAGSDDPEQTGTAAQ